MSPKKMEIEAKTQSFRCSNLECGKVFSNPIIVQDLNSKSRSSYYACPYCLTEIVMEEGSSFKGKGKDTVKKSKVKMTKKRPVKTKLIQQPTSEVHDCPHFFGYLSQRSKKDKIPEECMTCEKIVQCMLKKITG